MTLIDASAPDAPARPATGATAQKARWGWSQSIVMLIATIGIVVLVYPTAASWFSAWSHDTDVDGYIQSVEQIPDEAVDEMLAAAEEYNENLPTGPLRDPYALGADGQQTAIGEGASAYFDTLTTEGTDTMARIRIPSIHVDLPVFHGTDEDTLSRGIGHLYGSSLPVGGPGTLSVLTGHNGFVQATLFDDIDELVEGDVIIVSALGEDLYYEVDQTKTVLPDDAEDLRQVAGKDYLTLVTCTPTGVNTHRLLVRAERIDAPTEDSAVTTIADTTDPAGFPWWALLVVGVPALTFIVVKPRRARKNRSGRRATHVSAGSDS
ncbi:class C sortase [Microbacterium sp. LMC-P-041]|uniref:class C sortase n=1 Tax=Microbacterium sp. LMC-P-041 TaxID=3040293 RepID=UPI002556191D|nr:class C sortase [Microbacterium sp. LMC-P-041]